MDCRGRGQRGRVKRRFFVKNSRGAFSEYSATFASVNCKDMSVSAKCAVLRELRWHHGEFSPSLRQKCSVFEGGFLLQYFAKGVILC